MRVSSLWSSRRLQMFSFSSAVALGSLFASTTSTTSAFVSTSTSAPFFTHSTHSMSTTSCCSATSTDYMGAMQEAASEALGRPVQLKPASGGGFSGGGGASTSAVEDAETGDKYFVKAASRDGGMLRAEYLGVKAMADTHTIQVPTPICFGEHQGRNFVLFEYLNMAGGGSQYELGVQLAKVRDSSFCFLTYKIFRLLHMQQTTKIPSINNYL